MGLFSKVFGTYSDRELKQIYPIVDKIEALAEEYRGKLIESVAETDDALMEKYFAGEELTEEEIKDAIRKATIACTMNPVC